MSKLKILDSKGSPAGEFEVADGLLEMDKGASAVQKPTSTSCNTDLGRQKDMNGYAASLLKGEGIVTPLPQTTNDFPDGQLTLAGGASFY